MERIKEIVSAFINVPPGQIGPATPIDRSTVQSSILLHRMYARLADEGIRIDDYSKIKVFGDLSKEDPGSAVPSWSIPANTGVDIRSIDIPGIGIDVEEIASLPETTDFRNAEFYKMNFSPEEMAYCILQQDPYASFAGLFAAKEAIVKAGGHPIGRSFNTIRITHSAAGRPMHAGYAISISHSAGIAAAVAARPAYLLPAEGPSEEGKTIPPSRDRISWVAWTALLVGLATLCIVLFRRP